MRPPSDRIVDYLIVTAAVSGMGRRRCTQQEPERQIASGSQNCAGMVVVPSSMKTLRDRARVVAQSRGARSRRDAEGAGRMIIVPRETPMSLRS
jgi:3-polyprenyl-4-hydroxybenzoate decarboxylase